MCPVALPALTVTIAALVQEFEYRFVPEAGAEERNVPKLVRFLNQLFGYPHKGGLEVTLEPAAGK